MRTFRLVTRQVRALGYVKAWTGLQPDLALVAASLEWQKWPVDPAAGSNVNLRRSLRFLQVWCWFPQWPHSSGLPTLMVRPLKWPDRPQRTLAGKALLLGAPGIQSARAEYRLLRTAEKALERGYWNTRPVERIWWLATVDGRGGDGESQSEALAGALPEDLGPISEWADWLVEKGDPRGDLLVQALAVRDRWELEAACGPREGA